MKRINSLSDLLMEELADLLSAENQLDDTLPKLAEASQSPVLKSILGEHWGVTKVHAHRLQDIFSNTQQHPQEMVCKLMAGFIRESEDVVNSIEKSQARDAAIIDVVKRMEQYEISGYQRACEHASDLGHTMMVEILTKTLNEEREMHLRLSELAQGFINTQAVNAPSKGESGGFYFSERKFKRGVVKKKPKNTDVSRYINEGNPNVEGPQNPEEQGDLS